MLTYLAIGDSLTIGRSSSTGGFVPIYRQLVSNQLQQPIRLNKLAKSGLTCGQILRLAMSPSGQKQIYSANIITITAGGNDLLHALRRVQSTGSVTPLLEASSQIHDCLQTLVHRICEIKAGCDFPYIIRVYNIYNPILGVPLLDQQLSRFNRSLYSLEQNRHVRLVDIGSLFSRKGADYLSKDRIHPNQTGYHMMADAAIRTGLYPL